MVSITCIVSNLSLCITCREIAAEQRCVSAMLFARTVLPFDVTNADFLQWRN